MRRPPARRLASVALTALVLACPADTSSPAGDAVHAAHHAGWRTPDAVANPEDVVTTVDVDVSSATLSVSVLPLVRTDNGLVLTLDARVDGDTAAGAATDLATATRSGAPAIAAWWMGLRLIDMVGDRVAPVALDSEGEPVASRPPVYPATATARVQLLFGDPGVDQLALFVPQGPLVTGIPVIAADAPALPDEQDPLDVAAAASAAVQPMIDFRYDLATTTRIDSTTDGVTIALGADVLFATDSAELTPAAIAVIEAAAAELQSRQPGAVQVVGHTDDRGTDPYNQDLSERRASAVAGALGPFIDPAAYPMEVSGRGETEPVAENTSDDGRQANRRVELILQTPTVTTSTEVREMPPPPDLVAPGDVGVEVEIARPYRITAGPARVVNGHLVVELTITALDTAVGSAFGPAVLAGRYPGPPGLERQRTMAGVAVLHGSKAVMPVFHAAGDAARTVLPLTDLATFNRLDGGDSRTSVILYPRDVPVGDTITLQLIDAASNAWRLTEIPIER